MADPAGSVLLFDLDGTLAPIVAEPAAARPAAGVVERLRALADRYRVVGVVSGRPVSFLAEHLPAEVVLSGLYGLERRVAGATAVLPEAERWRPVVADAVAELEAAAPPGVVVEAKGLSLTVHHRARPELGDEVRALAQAVGVAHGLEVRGAKMSVELHPPVASDKGSALRSLAGDATAVLFAGDDRGDLPAFAALRDLRAAGVATLAVAVGGAELPGEVREAADLVLPGVEAVPDLLDALLGLPS